MSNFHYPASPNINVDEIVKVGAGYKSNVIKVLLSILVFILGYLFVLAASVFLIYFGAILAVKILAFRAGWFTLLGAAGIMLVVIMFFVFVIKFMFKIKKEDTSNMIEITRQEHPLLFQFVEKVCEEIKAPFPKKIVISAAVNASVYYNSSFLSMFFPVRKNLEIGLGLVTCVNMTEFKAIIAHEFGHFSQSSTRLGSYIYRFNRMIHNLLYDNDSWANALNSVSSIHVILSLFGQITVGMANLVLRFFVQLYKLININYLSLSREMEFHADSVAVSVSGSKPIISALYRLEFAQEAYNYTVSGIINYNKEDKRYAENFFSLLERNITVLANLNNLPLDRNLPVITTETANKNLLENRIQYKNIWSSHPPTLEREKNANRIFLDSKIINDSPWTLFTEPVKFQKKLSTHINELQTNTSEKVDNETLLNYFKNEELENTLNPIYNDFYTYATNTYALPDKENLNAIANLNINDLYNNDILLMLKRHNKNLYDTEVIKNISEGHLDVKKFDFDGKPYRRYYSADIYKQLKDETEQEKLKIKAHIQKIANWFYFKANGIDAQLADRYLLLMAFRDKMAKDRETLIELFNTVLEFFNKELNKNLHEDDLPHLRKKTDELYQSYLKIKRETEEGTVPSVLLTQDTFINGYKASIFCKEIEDPGSYKNLEGFGVFANGLQKLIEDCALADVKVYKTVMKTQEEILEIINLS